MSSIAEQINKQLIDAMKAKDELVVSTLRLLVSAFKNKQIEVGHELSDEEVLDVIGKAAKQRRESIEAYNKGGREDLAEKESNELSIIDKYLPAQLGEDEITTIVDEVISETGASTRVEMGKVMSEVMKKVKGQADGNLVSRVVSQKLS